MPRYFFHIFNGHAHPDMDGTELPGLEKARQEAIRTAGEILRHGNADSWQGSDWHMEVTDAVGKGVLWVRFSDEEMSGKAA